MTAILVILYVLVALGPISSTLFCLLLCSEWAMLLDTPILHCFHWTEWRFKADHIWYDGHHFYLWIGPLVVSLDP